MYLLLTVSRWTRADNPGKFGASAESCGDTGAGGARAGDLREQHHLSGWCGDGSGRDSGCGGE
jgi:hypothetical protein